MQIEKFVVTGFSGKGVSRGKSGYSVEEERTREMH